MRTMSQSVLGQQENIRILWASLLIGGHVLLEGVPGLGKTLMVRSLAQVIDGTSARIQFTPDLMPSDVTGTKVFDLQSGRFSFRKGPIFTNILLADEINRTPPKTQAALLEAMEEKQVTIDGDTFALPPLFLVVATQNPIEHEGTYLLPEAQLDRFAVKLMVGYPDEEQEMFLLSTHQLDERREKKLQPVVSINDLLHIRTELEQIAVEPAVMQYLLSIVRATRKHPKVALGASPRAGLTLLSLAKAEAAMNGRAFVTPDDIKGMVKPALRHRLILHPDGELEGWKADDILDEILQATVVPR
ncbi:AAA family ATPase [Lihuaxuella thermophila]|nr:MoxR family ATPase [Lihuaxuella thermophila]